MTQHILSEDYLELLKRLDDHFYQHGSNTFDRQLHQIQAELGEVAEAWIGVHGNNPRKGITHTEDDVAGELADVVVTALVAIRMIGADINTTLRAQREKTERRLAIFEAGLSP